MKFFSKIGSIVGSSSSSTLSNRHGFPDLIQPSKLLRKTLAPSFKFNTLNYIFLDSLYLIQFTAYSWGSIHKGHLDDLVVKIPF